MRSFGLDISDSIIRLAVLTRHGKGFSLPIRGELAVPDGLINDGDFVSPPQVSDLIRRLVMAAKPNTKLVISSLPERHSFIKSIIFPPDQEINEAAIKESVTQDLPYTWEEINYDWVQRPAPKGEAKIVMFSAAPKKLVTQYLQVLEQAGLEVIGLENESLAIARAMLPPDATGANILLDIGRTRTSLILVNDGVVEFSTTIRYAGKDLNKYIAEAMSISLDQAQRAKELFGLDPDRGHGLLAKILAPQLDLMADKVTMVQDYYADHFSKDQPITAVLLNGSGALIRNIDQELNSRLKENVKVQPCWVVPPPASISASSNDVSFTYTTAMGLALQPFLTVP
jgi:type IV pilus assembly protein PilM